MSAQKVIIPLYQGIKGDLKEFFYSKDGALDRGKVYWLVPIAAFTPDGIPVGEIKTIPTFERYEGNFELVLWDKLRQATPKKVATIFVDALTDSYQVVVEERYMHLRLVMELNLTLANNEVNQALLYRNNTHHGDPAYKDKL